MLAEARLNQILDSLPGGRLAIAFSGGGDSTALVHLCRTLKPAPLILIVDHALRAGSKSEAENAARFAKSLGLETRLLTWDHDKPTTGLQEKARRARYGLMGEICRAEGISYLLTAHTQDDQAETLFMRYERNTGWRGAAGMAQQSYAPVWPELAKVTLVRPLLETTRAELRAYNRHHDLGWTEDPSNENQIFERVRTRHYLKNHGKMAKMLLQNAKELAQGRQKENARLRHELSQKIRIEHGTGYVFITGELSTLAWKMVLQIASGTQNAARQEAVEKLKRGIAAPDFVSRTLGGAIIIQQENRLAVGADPGPYQGREGRPGLQDKLLKKGTSCIWGGRFFVKAREIDIHIISGYSAYGKRNLLPGQFPYDFTSHTSPLMLAAPFFSNRLPRFYEEVGRISQVHVACESLAEERLNGLLTFCV